MIGTNFGDGFGTSVAINAAGTRVAIGAPFVSSFNVVWSSIDLPVTTKRLFSMNLCPVNYFFVSVR